MQSLCVWSSWDRTYRSNQVAGSGEGARKHIVVARQVLGHRMNYNICSQRQHLTHARADRSAPAGCGLSQMVYNVWA
jgi:hypothetical protein